MKLPTHLTRPIPTRQRAKATAVDLDTVAPYPAKDAATAPRQAPN